MGKAAENEKQKLNASFHNNIATALVITGFVVPYLAFLQKVLEGGGLASLAGMMTAKGLIAIIGFAIMTASALALSIFHRNIAYGFLDKLSD